MNHKDKPFPKPVHTSNFSPHDLRCGNILNYRTEENQILPTVIDWQDLKWLTEDPISFNDAHSGLPLTEEYLFKFGFDKSEYKRGYIGKEFKSGSGIFLDFVLSEPKAKGDWEDIYTFDLLHHRYTTVRYVHVLQNLYHAVTGQFLSLTLS